MNPAHFTRARTACVLGAVAVAVVVLAGWATGNPGLSRFVHGRPTMPVSSALGVLLLASALLLRRRRVAAACAVLAAALGALVLLELALGVDLPGRLIPHGGTASTHPEPTAPSTAVVFVLLGTAALLLPRGSRAARAGHACALAAFAVCLIAVVGLGSGALDLSAGRATQMGVPAAAALTLLAVATLLTRLDLGTGLALSRPDMEGAILRVWLVPAIGLPLVLGYVRDGLVEAGLSHAGADWLYTVMGVTVMVATAAVFARRLGRASAALAETTARLRALVELSPLGIVTVDPEGTVTSWNPGAERLFGWTAEEAIGAPYPLLDDEGRRAMLARFDEYDAGVTVEDDRVALRKDGTELPVRVAAAASLGADGSFAGVSAMLTDISTRLAVRNELEQRVAERTAELAAANRELQAFSYSVSHDLRAPLRALDGFATALAEDYGDALDETAHEYIGRIRGAAHRMGALIDDVLTLARVTRVELRREPIDVTALARTVGEEIREANPDVRVELAVDDGLRAEGDPQLVRLVLQNLLENAWKFASKSERPRVEVRAAADGGLEVADNGVGFDAMYVDKLFTPFQRLHTTAEYPGNGIGLATVRNIVNRHGGEVRASSSPAGGATFSFTLDPNGGRHAQ